MLANLLTAGATLFSWWNNPFLVRSFRAEWRNRNPLWAFFGLSALLAAPVGAVLLAAAAVGPYGFPERWGGSWGGLAFTLLGALHMPLVWRASMAGRRREWIPLESKLGTLELVLVSPMSRDEIVRKKALYPCCQAMIAALLGLPMYAICWAFGGFPMAQIIALYVLFLMIAFRPTLKLPHSILASSMRQQALHYLVPAACLLTWAAAAPGGGSRDPWMAMLSFPLTYANVVSGWLARPALFFSLPAFPLVLLLVVHAQLFGISVRLASAQLETTPEIAHEAVARRRFVLLWTLLALGIGLAYDPLIANGYLAKAIGLSVSPGEALCVSLSALILIVAGAELVERGSTLLSPLTVLRAWSGPGRPLWARTAVGVVHALATAVMLPAIVLACRVPAGPSASVGAPWLGACTLAVATGLVGCHGMGFLLFSSLRLRPRERSGLSLLATGLLAALPALARIEGVQELRWLAVGSPAAALIALCPEWATRVAGAPDALPPWPICAAGAAAVGLLLTGAGYLRLRALTADAEVAGGPLGGESRSARREVASGIVVRVQQRWDNPLTVLALRQACRSGSLVGTAVLGLSVGVAAVVYGLLVVPSLDGAPVPCRGGLAPPELSGFEAAAGLVPLLAGFVISLVTAISAGNSWVNEDRRKALGFILSSPLSREDIALGRFLGLALPGLLGLALTVPLAVGCAVASLSPAAPILVVLGYAWAVTSVFTCGHLALWLGMGGRGGVDSIGLPLAVFFILGLCRWWYLGAVCGVVSLFFAGASRPFASGGLYLLYLLIEVGVARRARFGAIACVEARRLTEPFGDRPSRSPGS